MSSRSRTITALANLPPGTMLDERALATALQVSTRTIRRMVDRHEIPPGIRLGARKMWLGERVLAYFEARAKREEAKANGRPRPCCCQRSTCHG